MVSIICPIYNEERFIEACIQSVLAQDLPKENWELLLVDGGSTDRTRALLAPYLERNANIRLLDNEHRMAPYAMNIGIRAAKGEYICRIDAHSTFPTNYVSTLLRYMNELPDATNVGGVCQTLPANDSPKAQAISIACSHPLGVGNSTFRTATIDKPTEVDTVPFGFWKKNLFDEIGLFDEELTRNQDDEFNARTIQHGGHIYLVPGICTTYFLPVWTLQTAGKQKDQSSCNNPAVYPLVVCIRLNHRTSVGFCSSGFGDPICLRHRTLSAGSHQYGYQIPQQIFTACVCHAPFQLRMGVSVRYWESVIQKIF